MDSAEMTIEQARAKLGDLVLSAMNGQTTTITRYGKPVAQIGPFKETTMRDRDMSNAELIEMHLSYGPGGNEHIDVEVWRRWPDLERKWNQYLLLSQKDAHAFYEAGGSLDDFPPSSPGADAAREEYMRAVRALT